jgi:hypothetical protein
MARLLPSVVAVILALTAASAAAEITPLTRWRQMRTRHFFLIGDVDEADLRHVASRLEQFCAAVGVILPGAAMTTAAPTTVIVFRSHSSYRPFKPLYNGAISDNVGGYFLGDGGVNHITFTVEGNAHEDRYSVIYHELAHLMISNTLRRVPPWLNEGLAEYYRTLEISSDGTSVVVGKPHAAHIRRLREQFIPLDQLVAVDRSSPLYNERESIFFAQSWALVHYLVLGENRKHAAAMGPLLDALAAGESLEQASRSALGMSAEQLQDGLRTYIGRDTFPILQYLLFEPLAAVEDVSAAPLPDADAHAITGSLLVRMRRTEDGRAHLQRALVLDPANAAAHSALRALHARQRTPAEARQAPPSDPMVECGPGSISCADGPGPGDVSVTYQMGPGSETRGKAFAIQLVSTLSAP